MDEKLKLAIYAPVVPPAFTTLTNQQGADIKYSTSDADLRQAILDFRAASKQMRSIAEANAEPLRTSIAHFGGASQRLTALSEKLGETPDALQRVVDRLDKGEGTLGKALDDPRLYEEMRETLRNTNSS